MQIDCRHCSYMQLFKFEFRANGFAHAHKDNTGRCARTTNVQRGICECVCNILRPRYLLRTWFVSLKYGVIWFFMASQLYILLCGFS
jgi:hypothetical protein